jgi:mRNA interferase RelE/StbE
VAYKVRFSARAQRQFDNLPRDAQWQLRPMILALADDPRPAPPLGIKLQSTRQTYRLRKGDWRVVYEIHEQEILILIVFVGNRRDAYRGD